jgi:hypothetical protein
MWFTSLNNNSFKNETLNKKKLKVSFINFISFIPLKFYNRFLGGYFLGPDLTVVGFVMPSLSFESGH